MTELPWMWLALRVSGLVAYGALWLSMFFGVAVAAKGAGGWLHIASAAELHRQWSVAGLLAAVVHGLATVLAPEGGVPALALLVPMVSPVLRGVVTMGTVALWGLVAVLATALYKGRSSPATWRAIHALAFGTWLLSLAHTLVGGTDVASGVAQAVVLGSAAVLAGLVVQRIALAVTRA